MKTPEPPEQIIARALHIERSGGKWTLKECAAVLRISLRTAQRNPKVRALYHRGIGGKILIEPKQVRAMERRMDGRR